MDVRQVRLDPSPCLPGTSPRDQRVAVDVEVSRRSPSNPSLKESILIGDKAVPAICHDPVQSLNTKRFQMAAFLGSNAQNW